MFVELRGNEPTGPSLFALGEARRVAHELGATVYALLTGTGAQADRLGEVPRRLGAFGADKILLCEHAHLEGAPLDATHGSALAAAADRVLPLLFMLPAGPVGPELGPRLAARLGAAFAPCAEIDLDGGRLRLLRWRAGRDDGRRLDPADLERPVVATLRAGPLPSVAGGDEADVDVVLLPDPGPPAVRELASDPDPVGEAALARGLLLLGSGSDGDAGAALRAAAPADVAVLSAPEAAGAALAGACPSFVLSVGDVSGAPCGSPATRLGRVGFAGAVPDRAAPADVAWATPLDADALGALAGALRGGAR